MTDNSMLACLTDRAAQPALRSGSFAARKRAAIFAEGVWRLHHIIASPGSRAREVKKAKRELLRQLKRSHLALPAKRATCGSRIHRSSENDPKASWFLPFSLPRPSIS